MKSVKILSWAGILALIFLSSCRETIIDDRDITTPEDPIILVESTIHGQVIDEDEIPVQDAVVKIGEEERITDKNGIFRFERGDFNKNGTLVRAQKDGYYIGVKMVNPALGAESYVRIELLTKDIVGNFESENGGTVLAVDGAGVIFSPNSIRTDAGNPYNGTVNVAVKWIDPTHDRIMERMPGDLRAWNTDDELVQLATYGMIAVELESPVGQKLNIAEGSTADIVLPLPTEIQGKAPATIPLWSFNEETGYWIEEGEATIDGNTYRGSVSHFSFWNCDAPFPVVPICGTVTDSNGNPLTNGRVKIFVNDDIGARYGWLNSDGFFEGKVPKNLTMTFTVEDLCGNVVLEEEIGPFTEKAEVGPFVADIDEPASLTGVLVNCDGDPVTNGYVYINMPYGLNTYWVDENGAFEISSFLCEDTEFELQGYDLDAFMTSEVILVSSTNSGQTVDLGTVTVCEDILEYVRVTVPELTYDRYTFVGLFAGDNSAVAEGIFVGSEQDTINFTFNFLTTAPNQTGTVDLDLQYSDWEASNPNGNGMYLFCDGGPCEGAEIEINEGPGGRFKATFTGDVWNEGVAEPVEMSLEVDVTLEE